MRMIWLIVGASVRCQEKINSVVLLLQSRFSLAHSLSLSHDLNAHFARLARMQFVNFFLRMQRNKRKCEYITLKFTLYNLINWNLIFVPLKMRWVFISKHLNWNEHSRAIQRSGSIFAHRNSYHYWKLVNWLLTTLPMPNGRVLTWLALLICFFSPANAILYKLLNMCWSRLSNVFAQKLKN